MKKCEDCVKQSQIDIYKQPMHLENIDPNYLLFDVYDEEIHGTLRRSWLQQKVCNFNNKYLIVSIVSSTYKS